MPLYVCPCLWVYLWQGSVSKHTVCLQSCCMFVWSVCLWWFRMYLHRMGIGVNLISPEWLRTPLSRCVTLHTHAHMSVCLSGRGPIDCTAYSAPVFFSSGDPNHVSAPSPPSPTLSSPCLLLTRSPYQVDPGPREGRPPGLVALSRAPQPPPLAPRHEPSLPKNQAGVETAQRRGGQKEVRP